MIQLYRSKIGSATPCGESWGIALSSRPFARARNGNTGCVQNCGKIASSTRKLAFEVAGGENLRSPVRQVGYAGAV